MRVKSKLISLAGLMLLVSLLMALLAPAAVVADTSSPVLPTAFYGTVTINGAPAPAGTVILGIITSAAGTPGNGSVTVTTPGQYGVAGLGSKLTVQTNNTSDIGKPITFNIVGYTITSMTTTYAAVYDSDVHMQNIAMTGQVIPTGGGGGAPPTLVINVPGGSGSTIISSTGVAQQSTTNTSSDGKIKLNISAGTTIKNADGTVPATISLTANPNPPPVPTPDHPVIGITYIGSPNGLTFNPPVTIVWTYDPASLPSGVSESSLKAAFYNTTTGLWEVVPCTVDPTTHTITATIAHFTTFAIIGTLNQTTTPLVATTTTTASTTAVIPTTTTTSTATALAIPTTTTATTSMVATTTPITTTTTPTVVSTPSTPSVNWGIILGIVGAIVVILIVVTMVVMRARK